MVQTAEAGTGDDLPSSGSSFGRWCSASFFQRDPTKAPPKCQERQDLFDRVAAIDREGTAGLRDAHARDRVRRTPGVAAVGRVVTARSADRL
jgi:hypothetical protein